MSEPAKGVHIAAGGFEYDRIMIPIMTQYPLEKLVILQSDTEEEYPGATKITQHFMDKIMDNPIPVELEDTDIYDFDSVFQKTVELIREYTFEDKLVYLNISSAPKLALAAMMAAAFFTPDRSNVKIFYGSPENYVIPQMVAELGLLTENRDKEASIENLEELGEKFMDNGMGEGVKEYEEIPVFPIQEITEVDRKVMRVLKNNEGVGSIKELIEGLEKQEDLDMKRSSLQYRMEKLVKMNLIERNPETRKVKVGLTRTGEIYLSSTGDNVD